MPYSEVLQTINSTKYYKLFENDGTSKNNEIKTQNKLLKWYCIEERKKHDEWSFNVHESVHTPI